MKYAFVLATVAALAVSPAMAGGPGSKAGSLIGNIVAPVTTSVSGVKVNALNNVGVLSGNNVANGNKVGVVAPVKAVLGGLLGGSGHGCGCN